MSGNHVPHRRCVGCYQSRPKAELIRLVRTADEWTIDKEAVLPGRGTYLCRSEDCLRLAIRRKRLPESIRTIL